MSGSNIMLVQFIWNNFTHAQNLIYSYQGTFLSISEIQKSWLFKSNKSDIQTNLIAIVMIDLRGSVVKYRFKMTSITTSDVYNDILKLINL